MGVTVGFFPREGTDSADAVGDVMITSGKVGLRRDAANSGGIFDMGAAPVGGWLDATSLVVGVVGSDGGREKSQGRGT